MAIASRKLDRLQAAKKTLEAATGRKCFIAQMDVRDVCLCLFVHTLVAAIIFYYYSKLGHRF